MTTITQDLIPTGRKNRPGKTNPMKYITIHNTGNTSKGAGAKNHASYLKSTGDAVSWHYTADESAVYQHIPDNETAYHAGDGSNGPGNATSIGIEICMNSDGNLLKATDNAAELAAFLCKKHGIPAENIVQHNRWTGKNCPQLLRAGKPYTWEAFIGKVRKLLDAAPVTTPTPTAPPKATDTPSPWAYAACKEAVESGIVEGDGQGWFGWKEPLTLERFLVLMKKMEG